MVMKNKILISLLAMIFLVAVGIAAYFLKEENKIPGSITTPIARGPIVPSLAEGSDLEQEDGPTAIPNLKPVSAEVFGDFGNVNKNSKPQQPDGPSKLGDQVEITKYQGVVTKDSKGNYRVLVGKLADKAEGKVELTDVFELTTTEEFTNLRVADPNILPIATDTIVKWANLPNDNQMVRALLAFKAEQ
jgi:hypothetical protein